LNPFIFEFLVSHSEFPDESHGRRKPAVIFCTQPVSLGKRVHIPRELFSFCRARISSLRDVDPSPRHSSSRYQPMQGRTTMAQAATAQDKTACLSATDLTPAQQVAVKGGVVAYLTVEGAAKASAFYAKAFGAEEQFRYPADEQGRTCHIHLYVNNASVMLCDPFPEFGCGFENRGAAGAENVLGRPLRSAARSLRRDVVHGRARLIRLEMNAARRREEGAMICCTLLTASVAGLLPPATFATSRWHTFALLTVAVVLAVLLTVHASHYIARAALNERSLLAEIAAQPLCSGAPLKEKQKSRRAT
jgi:hypothetical protein